MSDTFQAAQEASSNLLDRPRTPTGLKRPAFLMNFPFSYSTTIANNMWMEEIEPEQREPSFERAMIQFLELYRYLAAEALVYLLPTPRDRHLQDLVFTANLGVVPEHLESMDTVVLSNFSSEPRRGETDVGVGFFQAMGYQTYVAPARFEGDAELKHLHDNVYVGGYGIRSQRETYDWMERTFDMEVVRLELTDPYLYHLDCTVFPITRENALVCTEMYKKHELAALEKHTNIIDVSVDDCLTGICNSVRLSNTILNASNIYDLKAGTEEYVAELRKNRRLEDIASKLAFEVSYFNLGEYLKGGALLSCMVMHLNRHSYTFKLI
jgi:N-dimethylarginine dimethylaminohydrolase